VKVKNDVRRENTQGVYKGKRKVSVRKDPWEREIARE
jgi:hypothetical protein